MSEEWPIVTLGDVLQTVSRPEPVAPTKEYRLLGVRLDGGGPFLRETKLGSQSAATTLFKVETDDFIYSRLFAWRGAFGIISQELNGCYVSSEFPIFHPVPGKIDMEFLRLWFRLPKILSAVEAVCTGSTPLTRNRFKEGFFLKMKMPLPPLPEQRRIVARIDELAAKIEEAKGLRGEAVEEATVLLQSTLQNAFKHDGETTVRNFAMIQSGYAFKSEWFSSSGIRLVRNVNIGHGNIDWHQTEHIPASRRDEFPRFEIKSGDILISLDRPIISTGVKVARASEKDLPSLLLQRVGRVCFLDGSIAPDYFFAWLRSPNFVSAIDPGRSNGVPHISPKDVERVGFAAPPLPEQERIVAYLDGLQTKVDALKALQAETAAELAALLPSVLDRAFTGRL